ncbi:UNVERIFIED_ORG: ABC-type uncharacterized transport system substrate-binding protein [Xanthobacter viscosus]|jgi:ABC-type uncharacterized transport system substrate-binding protein|uniref:DUF1007 family protein n=1 Tax=Xanthobacter autotrophicus TaxID=280 RepID=A0A6C1KDA0_XANAU|nr:DUF1007 family protein [Xanthobacter autotrophicus]TLX42239.1 DUF1007 family protein [Xanthobacter autotrophicus]
MTPRTVTVALSLVTALLFAALAPRPAQAHPHVWVTMKSELVYDASGRLTGVKQIWTFDDAFSAFALQGMDKQKDGSYGDDVLKPLAEVNVTSLKEYNYFVVGKTATAKLAFKDPIDYFLTYENELLTLHFTLPLEKPVAAKGTTSLEIYDPTAFVSFSFNEKDPVKLVAAPAGCTQEVISPEPPASGTLNEAFFSNLTSASTYGAQFADKITVKCP